MLLRTSADGRNDLEGALAGAGVAIQYLLVTAVCARLARMSLMPTVHKAPARSKSAFKRVGSAWTGC